MEEVDAKRKDQAALIHVPSGSIRAIGVDQGPVAEGVLGDHPGSSPSTPVVAVTVDTEPPPISVDVDDCRPMRIMVDAAAADAQYNGGPSGGDEGWDAPIEEEVDYDAHTPLSV